MGREHYANVHHAQSKGSVVYQMHGAIPSLSANGAMNGIIWDIDNSGTTH